MRERARLLEGAREVQSKGSASAYEYCANVAGFIFQTVHAKPYGTAPGALLCILCFVFRASAWRCCCCCARIAVRLV